MADHPVYEGVKSFYKEEDETVPVNVYGKSKVAAEQFISTNFSNYAILRSSIIIGPQAISPVPKSLPIQWIDGVLSRGDKMDFFYDEFRCPVYVKDVVAIILALTTGWIADRVSRAQIAETVADVRGYDTLINQTSKRPAWLLSQSWAFNCQVDRGVKSPVDISMDITELIQTLHISPTSLRVEGQWCTKELRGRFGVRVWKAIRNGWDVFKANAKAQGRFKDQDEVLG
ncbi:hypothetical protein CK203_084955 [Vitis vinifera]|uniref:RmlD-like substrate binding domain-containing protein n=1 Tax=Vitis vinifera TaxID=29760 RepID=A0A438CXI7_VITVI|nr:hypothetical protein CK203_084955 [Vitis vinifera]